MANRRRQQPGLGMSGPSTFEELTEEGSRDPPPTLPYSSSSSISTSLSSTDNTDCSLSWSPSSLAAKAIRASSSRRDASLSSAYGHSNLSNASRHVEPVRSSLNASKDSKLYEYTSMKSMNESKNGFWGVLARKAKSFLEDDNGAQLSEKHGGMRREMTGIQSRGLHHNSHNMEDSNQRKDSPSLLKGLDAFTSSLSEIGDKIGNAFGEGLTKMETPTSSIIQETHKHIKKMPSKSKTQDQDMNYSTTSSQPQLRTQPNTQLQYNPELQLKASRDVAMAMAAKAKLLLRELKTVKADLAFAKERCAQLEEENKALRENRERGNDPEDDLIRLQLESLLAEKSRLAHENSIYARENRFLREVVEYHQLTMQDVVYLDEGNEEVTEVYPINMPSTPTMSVTVPTDPPATSTPPLTRDITIDMGLQVTEDGPRVVRENYSK